jgi:hypothetical protein
MRRPFAWILAGALSTSSLALANKRELADLKREIDTQHAAATDLERLDSARAVPEEITLLHSWLDEASAQLAKEETDKTREVLARCIAQAELIRQRITAAKGTYQANAREAAVKASREKVEKTKRDLQQALVDKKALEMTTK